MQTRARTRSSRSESSLQGMSAKALADAAQALKDLDWTGFLVYVLQILTIVCIQRYNTFYSLGLILWVFITGFTLKNKHLRNSILVLATPCLIAIYVTMIWYYIENN